MVKKIVGQVTAEEKNEIQTLFERRNGLNELAKILTADNGELYEKLVKDMGETGTRFQNWWDRMAGKYQWETADGGNWEINFDTCEIALWPTDKRTSPMIHPMIHPLFIGTTELLLIGGMALLLFGGKKLPEMMRGLGQGVKEFKKGMNDVKNAGGEAPQEETDALTDAPQNDAAAEADAPIRQTGNGKAADGGQ